MNFDVQKVLQNEQDLTEKSHTKIPTSYRIPNGYFQTKHLQKVDINFISLSRMTQPSKSGIQLENPGSDGAQ